MAGSARTWDATIVLSAFGAVAATWLAIPQPVRWVIVGWFLIVCPGMAIVKTLRLQVPAAEWMLAFAISIAIDMIVGEAMVYAGLWAPFAGLLLIACISVLTVAMPHLLAPEAAPRWVPVTDAAASDVAISSQDRRSLPRARGHRAPSALQGIASPPPNTPQMAAGSIQAAESIQAQAEPAAASKPRRHRKQPRATIGFDPLDEPMLEKRSGLGSEGIIRQLAVEHLKKRR